MSQRCDMCGRYAKKHEIENKVKAAKILEASKLTKKQREKAESKPELVVCDRCTFVDGPI